MLLGAGSHDKDTLIAATIAELLYPAAQHRKDGEPYNAFVARIKALFHKEVLAPLRRCLDVPEVQHLKLPALDCSVDTKHHHMNIRCTLAWLWCRNQCRDLSC